MRSTRELLSLKVFRSTAGKIKSPIGLNIGAITPSEIAISIISQLVCAKRLGQTEAAAHNVKINKDDSDLDLELFKI